MFKKFKTNPDYLSQFHFKSALILFFANCVLGYVLRPSIVDVLWYLPALYLMTSTKILRVISAFAYAVLVSAVTGHASYGALGWISIAVVMSFPFTSLLHGASHNAIKLRWLNRPVGELMGLIQLSGFPDWVVVHVLHHVHTDDPKADPHAPQKMSYWQYVLNVRESITATYGQYYLKVFGNTPKSQAALKKYGRYSRLDHTMKVVFWFLALGPKLFTFLFVASILFKMLNYAWLNHATHRWTEHGVEIQNYNHSLYRIVNFLSFGLYFHKNHHLSPGLFDPRNMRVAEQMAEQSISPEIAA